MCEFSAHLGSCPAEQRKSKLADGRDHQVHSDGPPRPASGLQAIFMISTRGPGAVIITLTLGVWTGWRSCITFVERFHTSFWACGSRVHFQFKDGETPFKTVHVGGRSSRTVVRLQIRVSCSFLVQKETLDGEKALVGSKRPTTIQISNRRHLKCCHHLITWDFNREATLGNSPTSLPSSGCVIRKSTSWPVGFPL